MNRFIMLILLSSSAQAAISTVTVEPQILIVRGDHLGKIRSATINGHRVRMMHRSGSSVELACAAKQDLVCKNWMWKGGEAHIELRGHGITYRQDVYVPYQPPSGGWGGS